MSPKLLIVQERGRHAKNRSFRECENFKRSFDRLGVQSEVWGLGYDNFSIPFSNIAKDYDVILVLENYDQTGWLPDLSSYKQLKLHWTIDCHCAGVARYLEFSRRSKINIHLNAAEQYINTFAGTCDKAYWFPNAYPDDLIYPKAGIQKHVEIGFCGSLIADRPQWTTLLEQRYGSRFRKHIFVIGDEMVDAVNSYQIALNKSIKDDLNYRVFETLGCKTFLITNEVPNIHRLFRDGEHLVVFGEIADMIEKIDWFLEHASERERIAAAGHEHVRSNHTYFARAQTLLRIIEQNI